MITTKKEIQLTAKTPFLGKEGVLKISPSMQGFISINGIKIDPIAIIEQNGEHTTIISDGNKTVSGVEHILSALWGMGYDSVEIETGDEMPMPDGSALGYTKLLKKAGKDIISKPQYYKSEKDIFFEYKGSLAIIRPAKKTKISALIQFGEPIGEQYFSFNLNQANYIKQIAPARTFIRSNCDRQVWKNVRKILGILPPERKDSPILTFENKKWDHNLRFENEPVRHKILDFIGDVSLLGKRLQGNITIIRPGHEFNRKLVKYLNSLEEHD